MNLPWFGLPEEVRSRVMERFKSITGKSPNAGLEDIDVKSALCDLGKSRLIEIFKGDVKKAIRWAEEHAHDPAVYGTDEAEWRSARKRTKELTRRFLNDPDFVSEGLLLHKLAEEEMAKRN